MMTELVKIPDEVQHRIETSDKILRFSLIGSILLILIMLALIVVQNQLNANKATANAARNHQRTQQYVKCVAEALTVQIPQRNLDQCTQTVDNQTKAVN